MNLIKIQLQESLKSIYFNNASVIEVLSIFEPDSQLVIEEFYGYSNTDYFYIENVSEVNSINKLIDFLNVHNDTIINNLAFSILVYKIDIIDLYEYHFSSESTDMRYLLIKILTKLFLVRDNEIEKILLMDGKYLLIDNGIVIDQFENFDDYLNSSYSI